MLQSDSAALYDAAERRIVQILKNDSYMANELVEKLTSEDYRKDIAATAMWLLIGDGTLKLSDEFRVST